MPNLIYTYRADEFCSDCILSQVIPTINGLRGLSSETIETLVSLIAERRGIDWTDERSFDSDTFPKVYIGSYDSTTDSEGNPRHCGSCHTSLREIL